MSEPVWIDEADVLAVHDRLLAEHGGAEGLRDETVLRSALGRPHHHLAYTGADIVDLAAVYTAGIVRNHPFVDGNKRTGFVVGVLFLELNGLEFYASEESAAQAVLQLAAGTVTEEDYRQFLRKNVRRLSRQRRR